jgi:hypothetical protein
MAIIHNPDSEYSREMQQWNTQKRHGGKNANGFDIDRISEDHVGDADWVDADIHEAATDKLAVEETSLGVVAGEAMVIPKVSCAVTKVGVKHPGVADFTCADELHDFAPNRETAAPDALHEEGALLACGCDHDFGFSSIDCKWLFAEDRLARGNGHQGLLFVEVVRSRDVNNVDIRVVYNICVCIRARVLRQNTKLFSIGCCFGCIP